MQPAAPPAPTPSEAATVAAEFDHDIPALTAAVRALAIAGVGGVSLGFHLGVLRIDEPLHDFFFLNGPAAQRSILMPMVAVTALLVLASCIYLGVAALRGGLPAAARSSHRLHAAVRLISPLFLLGPVPLLFEWSFWERRPLVFSVLVAAFSLAAYGTVRLAAAAMPRGAPCWHGPHKWVPREQGARWSRPSTPSLLLGAATLGYIGYFSYYTVAFHVSVRTGYDTSIYDNLVWNLVHGGPFFKSSSRFGPVGGHFGVHAELFAYVLAPFYAVYPRAHTLLVAQSVLIGAAAWPLYCFARRHVGEWFALAVAVVYLLHPAVHGANIFEFHFLPLGVVFLWAALHFLETHRDVLATVAIALTLSVREDVATWVLVLGVSLALTGTRPRAGLIVAAVGGLYFVLMKFVIMPRFSGAESFTFIYRALVPPGEEGPGAVLRTMLTNPAFTLTQVMDEFKLIYALQLLVPLFFLPLKRPIFLVLAAPMLFFLFLSTRYGAVVSVQFQYGMHAVVFMFVGVVWALERTLEIPRTRARTAAVIGMLAAAIPISYQFGAVLQQNTAYAGPIRFRFGVDPEGARRRDSIAKLLALVPPRAKVAASGFVTPQVTNRPDAYNLTVGVFDAEYLLIPSERRDFIVNELAKTEGLLRSGAFGVVAIERPFALARRGQGPEKNAEFWRLIRR